MLDQIQDTDRYVINPWFRLRNESDHVYVTGSDLGDPFRLMHVTAIVIALCNGKRTVGDLLRLARPLVENPAADDALAVTRRRVYAIIDKFRRDTTGQGDKGADYDASKELLIPPASLSAFTPLKPPIYEAEQFYPRNAFPRNGHNIALRERVPSSINWHLTSDCSTNCQYCYLGRRRIQPWKLLSKKRMLELVEEAARIGVPMVVPGGGDVILYPYLFDFLDAVSAHQFSPIRMATKSFVSPEMARRLAGCDLFYELQFSIDSTVAAVADYLVQTPGFYARTMRSIDNALEAGLRVVCKSVITPYNISTIPKLYRDLRHKGVETVRLATYCRTAYHHREGLFNHAEDYDWLDEQLEILREEFPDDQIYYQNGRPALARPESQEEREQRWAKRIRCGAGRTTMLICPDGKVIPCEQLPETEEMFVGDLKVQSIEQVWNSKKLDEITIHFPVDRYKNTVCHDCDEFAECHVEKGYCIRDTYIQYGTIYEAAPSCPRNSTYVRSL